MDKYKDLITLTLYGEDVPLRNVKCSEEIFDKKDIRLASLYSNISFEYQLDEITTNKETKIKFRFIFFDESLFTEINMFITKMNIKIKKYNLKKLKKG